MNETPRIALRKRWLFVAWAFILAVAGLVRLAGLEKVSLDFDEYLHVIPGQEMLRSGRSVLPSGFPYPRALPYTWMVSQCIKRFGSSEVAVRLPSIVFGVTLVLLAGWIAKRWWGSGASVIVMILLALEPFSMEMSRVCRMYAPFHFCYLFMWYAYYEALEGERNAWKRLAWGLSALATTGMAVKLHLLTADFFLGLGVFVLIQALLGRPTYRKFVIFGTIVGLPILAVGHRYLTDLWHEINTAPSYAAPWRYDYAFYLRQFWSLDPWIVMFIMPALIWWFRRHTTRGWYALCAIGAPFMVHSIIFDWKEARYLLHIVPIMVVIIGSALWAWGGWLARRFERSVFGEPTAEPRRLAPVTAGLLLAPMILTARIGHPPEGLDGELVEWRQAYEQLRPLIHPDEQLIISVPLVSIYYLNRPPDYVLLNVLIKDSGKRLPRQDGGLYHDWYSGSPLITSAEEMEMVFRKHPRGWIVVDVGRFSAESCVPKPVRAMIESRCKKHDLPVSSVIAYSWGI